MLCACFDQLKIGATYLNKSKKSIIHMDSSGDFLRMKGSKEKLLHTGIVIPPPAPGHAPFPILELISQSNKTIDYKILLETGMSLLSNAIGNEAVKSPSIAITDISFPNIHALLSVFNHVKIADYLEKCYSSFIAKTPIEFPTVVSFCTNHLIPLLLKSARASGTGKEVADTVVAGLMLVLEAKSIEEALTIWEQIVIAFCSKQVNPEVEKAGQFIKERSKGDFDQMDDQAKYHYDFDDETEKQEETVYGNRKLLRANSPFYRLFKRFLEKWKKCQEKISGINNTFYAPQCVEILLKQYLSLFPFLSGSVLEDGLITNTHVELYWKDQRRIIKDIPDRTMWPPRYLSRVLENIRREAKNFLLHNIIPTLKFGGKQKTGDEISFSDYFNETVTKNKDKQQFKPTKSKSQKMKQKPNETLYGSQEQWEPQRRQTPKKANYIKHKHIDLEAIAEDIDLPDDPITVAGAKKALAGKDDKVANKLTKIKTLKRKHEPNETLHGSQEQKQTSKKAKYIKHKNVDIEAIADEIDLPVVPIRVTGPKKALAGKDDEDASKLAPMAIVLQSDDIKYITQLHSYLTTDAVDAGLCLLDKKINEEGKSNVAVYSTQNCRLILNGERDWIKPGKFVTVIPRYFGPGGSAGHFTLVSNLFCEENEVNVYETFTPYRCVKGLLTENGIKLLKSLCNAEKKVLKVNCMDVAEQWESECGAIAVALAVNLCFSAPSENDVFKKTENVRQTFLNCMQNNSLTYFKLAPRYIEGKVLFTLKI